MCFSFTFKVMISPIVFEGKRYKERKKLPEKTVSLSIHCLRKKAHFETPDPDEDSYLETLAVNLGAKLLDFTKSWSTRTNDEILRFRISVKVEFHSSFIHSLSLLAFSRDSQGVRSTTSASKDKKLPQVSGC